MSRSDRKPPQSLEAERSVLGGCLLDASAVDLCAEILEPADFYRESHATLFEVIVHLRDNARPVDAVEVAEEMIRRGLYQKFGGNDALAEITGSVPHAANARYHAQVVRQTAMVRQVIQTSTETIAEAFSREHKAHELVERAEQRIFAIAEREATGTTLSASELIGEAMTALNTRERGERRGLSTGFTDLDGLLDGMRKQELIIVAARPSQGKSSFAANIGVSIALQGLSVLFVSLEMSHDDLTDRMLSGYSGVAGDILRRPWHLNDRQRETINAAADRLARANYRIDDNPRRTITQIAANARRIRARHGLELIIVDYLSLIDGQRIKGENRQEEVARLSRRLKAMARELNVPVLCLHQLNRQSEQREGHRPRLGDLRESGQIEQDADVVMLIHRPEYYDPDDQPGDAEIIVAKNRNGPTGLVRLHFNRGCTRFDSLEEQVQTY
jgi:replicative DNA helicase